MKKLLLILIGLFWVFILYAQPEKNEIALNNKLLEIRSNSRDITPIRRTNFHKPIDCRRNMAIRNNQRSELRNNRALQMKKRQMQNKKRQLQNKKRMMQQKTRMQKRAVIRRRMNNR